VLRSPLMMPWSSVSPSTTTSSVRFLAHLIPLEELIHSQELRSNASVMLRDITLLRTISNLFNRTGATKVVSLCLKLRFEISLPKSHRPLPSRGLSLRPSEVRILVEMLFQLLAKSATTIAPSTWKGLLLVKSQSVKLSSNKSSPSSGRLTNKNWLLLNKSRSRERHRALLLRNPRIRLRRRSTNKRAPI